MTQDDDEQIYCYKYQNLTGFGKSTHLHDGFLLSTHTPQYGESLQKKSRYFSWTRYSIIENLTISCLLLMDIRFIDCWPFSISKQGSHSFLSCFGKSDTNEKARYQSISNSAWRITFRGRDWSQDEKDDKRLIPFHKNIIRNEINVVIFYKHI